MVSEQASIFFTKSHVVHAMGTCSSHGGGGQALRRPTGLDIVTLGTHQINGSKRYPEESFKCLPDVFKKSLFA